MARRSVCGGTRPRGTSSPTSSGGGAGKTGLGNDADGRAEHDRPPGELLAQSQELGIEDNTLVMDSTDNGAEATCGDSPQSVVRSRSSAVGGPQSTCPRAQWAARHRRTTSDRRRMGVAAGFEWSECWAAWAFGPSMRRRAGSTKPRGLGAALLESGPPQPWGVDVLGKPRGGGHSPGEPIFSRRRDPATVRGTSPPCRRERVSGRGTRLRSVASRPSGRRGREA